MGFNVDKNKLTKSFTIGSAAGVNVFASVFDADADVDVSNDTADKITAIRVWINPVAGLTWDAAMPGDVLSYTVDDADAQTSEFSPAYVLTVKDGGSFDSTSHVRNVFEDIKFSCTWKGAIGARQILYALDWKDDSTNDAETMTATAAQAILISVGPTTAPAGPPVAPKGTGDLQLSTMELSLVIAGAVAMAAIIAVLVWLIRRG